MTNISIFCDESGHLEHDSQAVMVVGAVTCPTSELGRITSHLRDLREEFNLNRQYEMKWTKISSGKLDFYKKILDVFFYYNELSFRCILIPDKSHLDHENHHQTHDDWYYKMFYEMLRYLMHRNDEFRIYLDIKDTRGGPKLRRLHSFLNRYVSNIEKTKIERVQQIRSHESALLQLADVMIGAVGFENRNVGTSSAKMEIIRYLSHQQGVRSLTHTSRMSDRKFNLFVWAPWEK